MPSENKKKSEETVRVVVRCRPLGHKEIDQGRQSCVEVDSTRGSIEVVAIHVHCNVLKTPCSLKTPCFLKAPWPAPLKTPCSLKAPLAILKTPCPLKAKKFADCTRMRNFTFVTINRNKLLCEIICFLRNFSL